MRLLFVGDVCLANIDTETFTVDPQVDQLLAGADLRIANLESPLTMSEEKAPHHPISLKAEPRTNEMPPGPARTKLRRSGRQPLVPPTDPL